MFDANYKFWLGGFVEGEGSLVISIIKQDKAIYGILLQPEFNVAQHLNGLNILRNFKILFNNKGQICKKSGSPNVWVYTLKGIKNLNEYLIPFFKQ
jgi:LAGLIDADG endonuclease